MLLEKLFRVKFGQDSDLYGSVYFTGSLNRIKCPYLPRIYEVTSTTVTCFSLDSCHFFFTFKATLKCLNLADRKISELHNFENEISRIGFVNEKVLFIASKVLFSLFNFDNFETLSIKNTEDEYVNMVVVDYKSLKVYTGGSKCKIKVFTVEPFELLTEFGDHKSSVVQIILFKNSSFLAARDSSCIKI